MSCNGCRALRRGCSQSCILRPCLDWIDSPQAQVNATLFVSKFFGRSDLMSFIAAVPEKTRPCNFYLSLSKRGKKKLTCNVEKKMIIIYSILLLRFHPALVLNQDSLCRKSLCLCVDRFSNYNITKNHTIQQREKFQGTKAQGSEIGPH